MTITILIPTTGERPEFVDMAVKMIDAQTIRSQVQEILVIKNTRTDINTLVHNYRKGYEQAEGDLVFFWEDDDYYAPDYLETMVKAWEPDLQILGTNHTIYYHLGLKAWKMNRHLTHSSAMNIVLKAGIQNIPWEPMADPFLDLRIWKEVTRGNIKGKLIEELKSVGIKHGTGRAIGRGHSRDFPYKIQDPKGHFLASHVETQEIFEFYQMISARIS